MWRSTWTLLCHQCSADPAVNLTLLVRVCTIISLCLCQTSDPPHPSVQPPSFPPTSLKLPYHSLTHRTIREALSWWAKLPLCMTSPVGRAGEPGEKEMRGEMEIWLQRVWARPLPRRGPNQKQSIKKKVKRRRCWLMLTRRSSSVHSRKVRQEIKKVNYVTATPVWPDLDGLWVNRTEDWFTPQSRQLILLNVRKHSRISIRNILKMKCCSFYRWGLSWYCRRLAEFCCYGSIEIRAWATLQVNVPYLTTHVLRCGQEAHFNCARVCSRMSLPHI